MKKKMKKKIDMKNMTAEWGSIVVIRCASYIAFEIVFDLRTFCAMHVTKSQK